MNFGLALTEYLQTKEDQLDDDARNRIHTNPMRVLDSKNPDVQAALVDVPSLEDFVNEESKQHYAELQDLLNSANIGFRENPKLVRGLDYYNNCVFEWTTDTLGAQGAVCGGGRYDGLVAQLGGRDVLACGFAIGVERLVLILDSLEKVPQDAIQPIDVYVTCIGQNVTEQTLDLAQAIRESQPQLSVISHCGGGKFNSQLKRAFNSGAKIAIILERDDDGESILESAKIRRLDDSAETTSHKITEIPQKVAEFLKNSTS